MIDLFADEEPTPEETGSVWDEPEAPQGQQEEQETPKNYDAGEVKVKVSPEYAESAQGVSFTIKGAGRYDSAWFVQHAPNMRELLKTISDRTDVDDLTNQQVLLAAMELGYKISKKAASLDGAAPTTAPAGNSSGGAQQQRGKPAGATEAPNGEKHDCKCGQPMKFVSGFSEKTNSNYAFFSCPKPRESQCVKDNGRGYTVNYKG